MSGKNKIAFAGVMGSPIRHSLSPVIFSWMSKKFKFPLEYQKIEIAPKDLVIYVRALKKLTPLLGWNVTHPHKTQMAALVDKLSPEARAVRAVNVVQIRDEKLFGFNTDILGILETLREHKVSLAGKAALVYGAGGAATAVGYALGKKKAARVIYMSRTYSRSEQVCRLLQQKFPKTKFVPVPIDSDCPRAASVSIFINATPLGMKGYSGRLSLPQKIKSSAFGLDLVYRSDEAALLSDFLSDLKRRGIPGVDGLDMLIWQAMATWEIWVGAIQNRKNIKIELKQYLESHLGNRG